jgi:hypothetical protein
VTVGGGMCSFVTVDYLRIAGVPRSSIRVLTNLNQPWQTYEYLTRVSQIPRAERIRSDSASRPDNVWGFPSYALQEAFRCRTPAPLWQVLAEPVFADFYTPRLGMVLRGVEREARRIGYQDMVVHGEVRMIRRRAGGGYFTVLTPKPGTSSTKRIAFRSRDVHVAVGYPGLKFLPDLQRFRRWWTDEAVAAAGIPVREVVDHELYSLMVIMALVTTAMTGPLLSVLRAGRPAMSPVRTRAEMTLTG